MLFICAGLVQAGEGDALTADATADVYSKYIWRGQALNKEAVLQPSASLACYGFTGSAWGSLDLTGNNGHGGEFTEVDLTLDYTQGVPGLDGVTASAGAIHYQFPHTGCHSTSELYLGTGLSCTCDESQPSWCVGCLLNPAARVYYDVDEIRGAYFQFSVGHTIEKIARWTEDCFCHLQAGASLGLGTSNYNNGYFGVNRTEWNDLTVSVGLPVVVWSVTIRPSINYATMLGDDIRATTIDSDNAWVGVSMTYAF